MAVFFSSDDSNELTNRNDTNIPVNPPPVESNEAQLLIKDFLNQRNWSNSKLDLFVQQWHVLSAEIRLQTMQTIELSQLNNAIYKQLLEERALSGIGNAENANNKQQKLIEFAEQIGINDSRIKMQE